MSFFPLTPGLALVPVLVAGLCPPAFAGLKDAPGKTIVNTSGRPLKLVLVMVGKDGKVGASRPQSMAGAGAGEAAPEATIPVALEVDQPGEDDARFTPLLGEFDIGPAETIRVHLAAPAAGAAIQARFLLTDWQDAPVATFAFRIHPQHGPRLELLASRPGEKIECTPDRLEIGTAALPRGAGQGPAGSATESKAGDQ